MNTAPVDKKSLVICADDYGFSAQVSAAILELIETGRISATSVMTSMPDWQTAGREIIQLKSRQEQKFDLGLHLNFTDGQGLTQRFKNGFPPLKYWLVRSHTFIGNIQQLQHEMMAQLDRFAEVTGQLPDFIDGHQHVHQFPVFRQALIKMIAERSLRDKIWVRSTYPSFADSSTQLKTHIIALTGAKKFAKLCQTHNLITNNAFAGITNFKQPYEYQHFMQNWLSKCPDKTLMMCHPATANSMANDAIAAFRKIEYDYLRSSAFTDDCSRFNVVIETGSDVFQHQAA